MQVTCVNALAEGRKDLGVVYASVEGVNEQSFHECLEKLITMPSSLARQACSRRRFDSASRLLLGSAPALRGSDRQIDRAAGHSP